MSEEPARVGDHLAELGADLLTIEIDTIVTRNISGTKMPQVEHALIDVAIDLWRYVQPSMRDEEWNRQVHAGWSSWDACRKAAREAASTLAGPGQRLDDPRGGKLDRITSVCDQVKGLLYDTSKTHEAMAGGTLNPCGPSCRIARDAQGAITHEHDGQLVTYARPGGRLAMRLGFFRRLLNGLTRAPGRAEGYRSLPVDSRQRTLVRKIWEVGLEDIVMQTVIQLDGDIVTRVHPDCVGDDRLMQVHHEAVRVSQGVWKEIVDVATRLFEVVEHTLTRR